MIDTIPPFDPAAPSWDALARPLTLRLLDGSEVTLPPLPTPDLLSAQGISLPSRLPMCLETWRAALQATETPAAAEALLQELRHGVRLPAPTSPYDRPNSPTCAKHQQFVDDEIEDYVAQGVLRRLGQETTVPMHMRRGIMAIQVEVQQGAPRLVINGTPWGEQVEPPAKFAHEDLRQLASTLERGAWCTKFDIRRMFLCLPVAPESQPWLCVRWGGSLYTWCGLPLGLTHSPLAAHRFVRPAVRLLRRAGVKLCQYVDDALVFSDSPASATHSASAYAQVFARLGWLLHPRKCVVEPTQQVQFLGFVLHTQHPSCSYAPVVTMTSARRWSIVRAAKELARAARKGKEVRVRALASLVGAVVSTMAAFLPAQALTRATTKLLARAVQECGWRGTVTISQPVLDELSVIRATVAAELWTERPLSPPLTPTLVLTTDASGWGYGAFLSTPSDPDVPLFPPHQAVWPQSAHSPPPIPSFAQVLSHVISMTQKRLTQDQLTVLATMADLLERTPLITDKVDDGTKVAEPVGDSHSTVLETLGILLSVLHLADKIGGANLLVRTDNTTAIRAVTRAHSPSSPLLTRLGLLCRFALQVADTPLVAVIHLPGTSNTMADTASRGWLAGNARLEWPISRQHLSAALISLETTMPDLDAFASPANAVCARFWSLRPSPTAEAVDAMAQDWKGRSLYINPPFSLMQRVVTKLLHDRPRRTVLVTPDWPSTTWAVQLSQVATRSVLLPAEAVASGPQTNLPEPLTNPRWTMRAWLIEFSHGPSSSMQ